MPPGIVRSFYGQPVEERMETLSGITKLDKIPRAIVAFKADW